jgi:aminopeptidase N
MSPYTLAFVVFDFVKYPDVPFKLSVWSRPELTKYMNYSHHIGQKALNFLENLTQISYPLKEMNFVAVPDFNSGAMENWGLVTYRYDLLSKLK